MAVRTVSHSRIIVLGAMCFLLCGMAGCSKRQEPLEIVGGTRLTYAIDAPEGTYDPQEFVKPMRGRADALGLRKVQVYCLGTNRIVVDIPRSQPNAVARLKAVLAPIGRLEFRLVADPQINKVQLEELEKTGKAPRGWHKYTIVREDPREPGKMSNEDVLIEDKPQLTGDGIKWVDVGPGGGSGAEIAVHLTFVDRDAFWRVTVDNVNRRLAIILDDVRDKDNNLAQLGRVHSAPVILAPILGAAEITGGFTQKTAEDLKYVLQSGSLKHHLTLEKEEHIKPGKSPDPEHKDSQGT